MARGFGRVIWEYDLRKSLAFHLGELFGGGRHDGVGGGDVGLLLGFGHLGLVGCCLWELKCTL